MCEQTGSPRQTNRTRCRTSDRQLKYYLYYVTCRRGPRNVRRPLAIAVVVALILSSVLATVMSTRTTVTIGGPSATGTPLEVKAAADLAKLTSALNRSGQLGNGSSLHPSFCLSCVFNGIANTWECTAEAMVVTVLGAACFVDMTQGQPGSVTYNGLNPSAEAANVVTYGSALFNHTASEWTNINGTMPELLSYLEDRAVAEVPGFIGETNWTTSLYDQIAIDSGLIPIVAGYTASIESQIWIDWNATINTWDNAFTGSGAYSHDQAAISVQIPSDSAYDLIGNNSAGTIISGDWQYLTTTSTTGNVYLYLPPGAEIILPCLSAVSRANCNGYTAENFTDLSQGKNYTIPMVNTSAFFNGTVPASAKESGLGQFDLLEINAGSYNCVRPLSGFGCMYAIKGGWVFANTTNPSANQFLQQVPFIDTTNGFGSFGSAEVPFTQGLPVSDLEYLCIGLGSATGSTCTTYEAKALGNATAYGAGPGSISDTNVEATFLPAFQTLVNETMAVAYEYYTTMELITHNDEDPIPANCILPGPQDAIPSDSDPLTYGLNVTNGLALYWAWLNGVGHFFGSSFVGSNPNFCGDSNLTFVFNWSGSWKPKLNITADIYLANGTGPVAVDGGSAALETYNAPNSWAVTGVDPTYIFPFDYQLNVPVGTVYPLPHNDPVAGVLVNWTGNVQYGTPGSGSPAWGVPTYLDLMGNGNTVSISGNLTNTSSGRANDTGDAIYIVSCLKNGVPQTICQIPVNFVNNLTTGKAGSLSGKGGGGGGGGGFGGSNCGTGGLNQWYDAWAANIIVASASLFIYIGNAAAGIPIIGGGLQYFFTGLGCIIGYIVLIIIIILIAFLVKWLLGFGGGLLPKRSGSRSAKSGGGAGSSSNVTINLDVPRGTRPR
jgi:hypothetical protein